ncbi:hypothetical protein [Nocardioides sp. Kera G14]|uniref:hypothetical protein n=1 Tax=Nocardioides sp. Kera G14 TaxID=2884264 RepID=UPI001D0F9B84|nr:hypothetical protein [Nocardioides sp. Kera G14]UDY22540.1 hypothetical protein LH076_10665 [Nocardioides sp. Kera G14]
MTLGKPVKRWVKGRLPSARRASAAAASGASAIASIGAWVATVIVARLSSTADYALFATLWSLLFGFGGLALGLQFHAMREELRGETASGSTGVGLVSACGFALIAWALLPRGEFGGFTLAALVIGCVGMVPLFTALGRASARGAWGWYFALTALDSVVRLVLVTLCGLSDAPTWVWALALGLPAYVCAAYRAPRRAGAADGSGLPAGRSRLRLVLTMTATGCASVLLSGMPMLAGFLRGLPTGDVAPVFAALLLFRAPLVLVSGLRPILLIRALRSHASAGAAVWWSWRAVLVAAVPLSALAVTIGPAALRAVFGPDYQITRGAAIELSVGTLLLALAMTSGMVLTALRQGAPEIAGWVAGLLVTVVALLLPLGVADAVLLAGMVGPLCAAVVNLFQSLRRQNDAHARPVA